MWHYIKVLFTQIYKQSYEYNFFESSNLLLCRDVNESVFRVTPMPVSQTLIFISLFNNITTGTIPAVINLAVTDNV